MIAIVLILGCCIRLAATLIGCSKESAHVACYLLFLLKGSPFELVQQKYDPESHIEMANRLYHEEARMRMDMNSSAVRTAILSFVNTNFLMGTNSVKFTDEDSFMEKGIVDSTGVLEMVNFIQNSFGVTINDEDLTPDNLDSVNNIMAFVERKQMQGS